MIQEIRLKYNENCNMYELWYSSNLRSLQDSYGFKFYDWLSKEIRDNESFGIYNTVSICGDHLMFPVEYLNEASLKFLNDKLKEAETIKWKDYRL